MNVSNGPRLGVLDGAGHGTPVHDWLGWAEAVAACAALGVDPPRRLGFPDGAVADHEDARTESLKEALAPDEVWLATWRADGRPDHEATGRAPARACAYRSQARGVPRLDVALGRASRPDRPVAAGAPPPAATTEPVPNTLLCSAIGPSWTRPRPVPTRSCRRSSSTAL